MNGWFGNADTGPFIIFETPHLIMLVIYLVGLVGLFSTYKIIRNNSIAYSIIRWALFVMLIASELSYQIWAVANGIWQANEQLPMQLCGIAGIIAAIALLTENKRLIIIAYFIGFIPALLAIITPGLQFGFPHFRYWKFFIHHLAISWASIFLVLTSGVQITFRAMWEAYGLLIIYASLVGFAINPLLDANFLYLDSTPDASTPLDWLGTGIWYYVNLSLLGIAVFSMLVGLAKLFKADLEMEAEIGRGKGRYLS
ncbi:TIGR02206 family membrane protein [Virgibacillus sp. 179-BFC.A HS]|uniref:TIGR02206 family membrane protein n=1 Tax=Tigheibacillus jepli TaxID=3035914 RepID=A0ABU5CJB7_9BACI|nr:TIGR02206 family membrane protein [Virgibacillus sp. 179-BFC.A HS]MDY0406419.1 TIGR02206 family membrane protein [Virgibacillus sp. 179-BFC.A HS]